VPRALRDEPTRDDPRLPQHRGLALDGATQQLRRDRRPRRIAVAAVSRDAREACAPAGYDERADFRARAGERDRHMIDVRAHERGGRHHAMNDEDDGRGIRSDAPDSIEAVGGVDVVALGGETRGHRIAMLVGHVVGALDHDAAGGRGIRHQRAADA
jgi:hypothetical protein